MFVFHQILAISSVSNDTDCCQRGKGVTEKRKRKLRVQEEQKKIQCSIFWEFSCREDTASIFTVLTFSRRGQCTFCKDSQHFPRCSSYSLRLKHSAWLLWHRSSRRQYLTEWVRLAWPTGHSVPPVPVSKQRIRGTVKEAPDAF